MTMNAIKRLKPAEIVLIILALLFSWLLMNKTFRLDADGNMEIALKVWSDFAATIPLIRSFSFGSNFPPQFPLFSGPAIRYHFAFAWTVGMLEKLGLPLDLALNIPSTLAFAGLLIAIYFFGKIVFKSKAVGMLSIVLFLFNASFSFLEFFKINPPGPNTLKQIVSNTEFSSFGPYDGKIVSAFWNLNIYTNQRHLALAFTAFLITLLVIHIASKKPNYLTTTKMAAIIIVVGLFPFIHLAIWGAMGLALGISFVIYPKIRKKILIIGILSFIISIPQIFYMGIGTQKTGSNLFKPGYLVETLTVQNTLNYWLYNLGLILILLPAAIYVANKDQRKIFIIFFSLFVAGNLFQFSKEIAANHKFFNLFIIGSAMYVANLLVYLWKKSPSLKMAVIILAFFLTLSGIIDIFPIFNDSKMVIADIPHNKMANYIANNIPRDSIVLNSSFLYHPASIAGRKIFMGWPYFAWSAGYNTHERDIILRKIYTSKVKVEVCKLLKKNNVDYFTTQDTSADPNLPNIDTNYFTNNYHLLYSNNGMSIYSTEKSCQHI